MLLAEGSALLAGLHVIGAQIAVDLADTLEEGTQIQSFPSEAEIHAVGIARHRAADDRHVLVVDRTAVIHIGIDQIAGLGRHAVLRTVLVHPVGLLLRAGHSHAFEPVDRVDGRSLLIADRAAAARGALHVDDLVDHVRQVGLDAEREIAPLVMIPDGDLPTHVAHRSGILIGGAETDDRRDIERKQNIVGLLVIPVGRDAQLVEKRSVDTHVVHFGRFPGNVGIGQRRLRDDRGDDVVDRNRADVQLLDRGIVRADVLVAQLAVGGADLEFAQRPAYILHERLLGQTPRSGERGEDTPAIPLGETRRAVETDVRLEKVTLLEVVVQTAEEGLQRPLRMTAAVVLRLVVGTGADHLVIGIGEVLAVRRKGLVVVGLARSAQQQFEIVVLREGMLQGGRELVVAVERAVGRLVEVVERDVGAVRHRAEGVGVEFHLLDEGMVVGRHVARGDHAFERQPLDGLEGERHGSVQADRVVLHVASLAFERRQDVGAAARQTGPVARRPARQDQRVARVHVVEQRILLRDAAAVAVDERNVEAHRELVREVDVHVVAHVVPLVVGALDDALLVEVAERGHDAHAFGAGRQREIVVVGESRSGENLVLPVGERIVVGIDTVVLAVAGDVVVGIDRLLAVVERRFAAEDHVLLGADRFGRVGGRLPADVTAVGDRRLPLLAALGRHEDDAVGRT